MTEQEKLKVERQELRILIRKGMSFSTVGKMPRKWWQFWKKPVSLGRTHTIKEPTLAVLDLLSTYWVDMQEDVKAGDETISPLKLQKKYALKMSEIVAIATLGEECFDEKYNVRWKKINEEAKYFAHNVHTQDLLKITEFVTLSGNIMDFMDSMGSMCLARSTKRKDNIE